jgi:hypothetical protein
MDKVLLLIFALGLCSCESSGTKTGTGSVVGNGLITDTLLIYKNEGMAIEFAYPASWSLAVSSDQTIARLTHPNAQSGGSESVLSFQLKEDYDGVRFQTADELLDRLQLIHPGRPWTPVAFRWGQSGFFWQRYTASRASGEYILLTTDFKILLATYEVSISLDDYNTIRRIIDSLTVRN